MKAGEHFELERTTLPGYAWLVRHTRPVILAGLTVVAYFAAINRTQSLL